MHETELHVTEIPVLGIVTRFVSNSEAVLADVESAFGRWRSLDPALIGRHPVQSIRIMVVDGAARDDVAHDDVAHRMPGDGRLLIHSRAAVGVSDPQRGEAVAWLTTELVARPESFRYDVLEALTWALLTRCDRQPLHAAAIVSDGAGLLLCGPSGAGKSTIAWAAARAGTTVMSEDIVFVQSQPHVRVWAMPGAFRLLPDAAAGFAELAGSVPVRLHTGKRKVLVESPASDAAGSPVIEHCGVCVLAPRGASATARRLGPDDVGALLDLSADPGFDAFADSLPPALAALAVNGAWLLQPSSAPDESLPLIAAMLDDVAACCAPMQVRA